MQTFLVLLFAYTLSQFYRAFLAVIAPELSAELSFGAADLGAMSAVWFWVFAASQFVVGWALDRFGPRRTMALLMLAAVAGATLLAQANDRSDCLVGMGLIGLGCSPIYMGSLYLFGRTFPSDRFAFLSSILLGLGSAGNLLGATPLAWAAGAIGWRATFLLIAGLTAISACLVYVVLRDPPQAPSGKQATFLAGLREIAAIRALWPLVPITLTSYAVILAERGLWVGPYLADVHGLEPVMRGNVVLLMAAAMSAGALAFGPLDRMLSSRKWIVGITTGLTAVGFAGLAQVPAGAIAWSALLLAAIGGIGMSYAVLMAHARAFFPDHVLGRGITTMNFVFFAGAGVLQAASGVWLANLQAAGIASTAIYGQLHLSFALLLVVSLVIYVFSTEMPRR